MRTERSIPGPTGEHASGSRWGGSFLVPSLLCPLPCSGLEEEEGAEQKRKWGEGECRAGALERGRGGGWSGGAALWAPQPLETWGQPWCKPLLRMASCSDRQQLSEASGRDLPLACLEMLPGTSPNCRLELCPRREQKMPAGSQDPGGKAGRRGPPRPCSGPGSLACGRVLFRHGKSQALVPRRAVKPKGTSLALRPS